MTINTVPSCFFTTDVLDSLWGFAVLQYNTFDFKFLFHVYSVPIFCYLFDF